MSGKHFYDTNLLVYAIEQDGAESKKSATARRLLATGEGCVSTQVLAEFYRAVTNRRRDVPLKHDEAVAWVQFWKRLSVSAITIAHVDLALELVQRYGVGYFDAQILAAAHFCCCEIVYSEDLNPGQDYGGIVVVNPFLGIPEKPS